MAELTGFAADGAASTYNRLTNDRNPYITRAEDNAKYTIPSLMPKDSDDGGTNYATPWQSIGARGLNNLASKLMLAMFPVAQPFFKLNVSEMEVKQQAPDPQAMQQIVTGLSMVERIVLNYMEANSFRPSLYEAIRLLLVSGNVLLYVPTPDSGNGSMSALKVYRLNNFVVERDSLGNVLQMVTMEKVARGALPEDVRGALDGGGDSKPSEEVEIYTHIYRDAENPDTFLSYQEVDGEMIQGTEGSYPADSVPWFPVRLIRQAGEDYGRSFVEEYLGDLKSLENVQEAIVKMTMIAAKVLFFVNPNGVTQVRRVAKANSGDFVAGRKADIETFQLEKYNDFNMAKQAADGMESRLSYAFMLNSAVQRSGDRVTAEEIRYVAGELEDTLGGVYSLLSLELQLPLVKILLNELQATSKIPQLPQEAIEPAVATGLEALGRGHDLNKLDMFVDYMVKLQGVQDPDLNMANIKSRVLNSLGIDAVGLLLSEEEKQQMQSQQATNEGMMAGAQAGGAAAGQMGAEQAAQMAMQQQQQQM